MVILFMPPGSPAFEAFLAQLLQRVSFHRVATVDELYLCPLLKEDHPEPLRMIFAVQVDRLGLNLPIMGMVQVLTIHFSRRLQKSSGLLIVQSESQFHTKTFASWLLFVLNDLGCRFIGHPVIEMTADLANLSQWQKTTGISKEELLLKIGRKSMNRFLQQSPSPPLKEPRLTVLHASSRKTSNTLSLWHLVKPHLTGIRSEEYHVANGTIIDCIGCSYHTCLYYGRQQSCFYGGDIVQELFPAIESTDGIMWVCPNYNDSLSANLMAVINRLTALYRTRSFYDNRVYAVIVSGNSGSDVVARQLINALCINKGFQLPPTFCLTATAYDPGSLCQVPDIKKRAADFAARIRSDWLSAR